MPPDRSSGGPGDIATATDRPGPAGEGSHDLIDVLERIPDGVWECDREWRVVRLNRAAGRSLLGIGLEPDAVLGRDIWEAVPALAGSGTGAALRRAMADGTAAHLQESALVAGRWLDTHVFPTRRGVAVCSRDVTAQRLAEERLRLLADAGRILGSSLDAREMLTAIARLALPSFADCCAIDLVRAEGGIDRAVAAHVRPEKEALLIESVARVPAPRGPWVTGAVRAIEHGDTVVIRDLTPAQLERLVPDPERRAVVARLGLRSLIAVPLRVGGIAVGAIGFGITESDRRYDADDVGLAEELGRRAGEAIERARLYEGERRARADLARVLDSIRDAFLALDRDMRFTYVNRRAAELLRHPPAALVGQRVRDVLPELVDSRFAAAVREAIATGRAMRVEDLFRGAGVWIEARIYPTDDGISAFFQDVSERRRAQQAAELLAEAGDVLGASLDQTTTLRGVAMLAVPRLADCCIAYVPDETGRVRRLAIAASSEQRRALLEEVDQRWPHMPPAALVPRVIADGRTLFIEVVHDELLRRIAIDDDHLARLREMGLGSLMLVPLRARGETAGALLFATGASRRRLDKGDLRLVEQLADRVALALDNVRLYEAERVARAEAEAANLAKMQFLATMSHELRTPLNAIAGYAELLLLGIHGPVTEAQIDAIRRVQRSGRHLLALINNVLNFARIEAGRLDLRAGDVALRPLLAGLEALVLPQLEAKGLRYSCVAPGSELVARADGEKAQQILLNLLSNAIKFTPRGGEVALWCDVDAHGVRIHVRDTGVGIAPDKREAVFEPFVQLDRTLSSGHEGTGLGLAISRELARAMSGELDVQSEAGKGSTFTLTLPRGPFAP